MRSPIRALPLALLIGLVAAAPASAGQIVFNTNDEIHVANDDGSGERTLITKADVPGAVSVYDPFVQPNSNTVVFTARTPYDGFNSVYCGFSCAGVYRWDAGQITRMSYEPSPCPRNNPCSGLDVSPKISADGSRFFYDQIYYEPNSSGTFNSTSRDFEAPAVAQGVSQGTEQKGNCARPQSHVYSPVGMDFAYVDCVGSGSYDEAITFKPAGGAARTLASDDGTPVNLAFRPDGGRIVDSENGADPGIWSVSTDATNPDPQQIVSLSWDYQHSQSSTTPAFVGNDRIAYGYGGEIRVAPTSCHACTLDQTTKVLSAPDNKGLAWTSQTIPVVTRGSEQQQQQGGNQQQQQQQQQQNNQQQNGGGFTATLAPRSAKLRTALKGLAVPFQATGPGTLTLSAQLDARTAKKLKLVKKGTKAVTVASGKASPKAAGPASVKLSFTKAALKRLKKARSLKLSLTGTFAPASGAAQPVKATVTIKR